MANEGLEFLLRLALASSGAIMLVLMVRGWLRDRFGASLAYQVWLLVPVAMVAAALPAARATNTAVAAFFPPGAMPALAASALPVAGPGWSEVMLAAWATGALAALSMLALNHRRFVARLGVLVERDGLWFAARADSGPLLLGLLVPRIVVPADFMMRFSATERALIVAHEQRHAGRGDPWMNVLAAILQCAFWFNPLMYLAIGRLRFDQELACDAAVMERHPRQARDYAAAMLKTQAASTSSLATCHWQSSHPLKERIMQLQHPVPSAIRRGFGRLALVALTTACVGTALLARASVPADVQMYDLAMTLTTSEGVSTPRMRTAAGATSRLMVGDSASGWSAELRLDDVGNEKVFLKGKIASAGATVAEPSLQMRLGEKGRVRISGPGSSGTFDLEILITKADGPFKPSK